MVSAEPGTSSAATMKNAAEERSEGTRSLAPGQLRAPVDGDRLPLHGNLRAEFAQRDFGVVARPHRFAHRRDALGEQPRQQHAGLHLRARHRQRVIDRAQRRPLDFERRELPVPRRDRSAHLAPAAS